MENLVIIGSGPAGISASLYTARSNLSPLVISKGIGALEKAEKIDNFYGSEEGLTGPQLHEKGIQQAKRLGVRFLETEVLGIREEENFIVITSAGEIETKTVLLATGIKRATLNVPGRKELEGKGISYCAVCDAFFYRQKKAVIIGNGDFALHEARVLKPLAREVVILTNGEPAAFSETPEFSVDTRRIVIIGNGDFALHEARVLKPLAREVVILTNGEPAAFSETPEFSVDTRRIISFEGEDRLRAIAFEDGQQMETDGAFLAIGTAGSGEIVRQMGAELTEKGHIKVNEKMETTIQGLYAVGDCTGGMLQIAKAVYEGAAAGIAISSFFRKNKNNF